MVAGNRPLAHIYTSGLKHFVTEGLLRRATKHPLECPDPAAEFVLRDYEDPDLRRAPLEELTAHLFEVFSDCLLVPHAEQHESSAGLPLRGRGR
jgi:hypothetical protein